MRRIGIFSLLFALLFSLSGCGRHVTSPSSGDFQDAWDEAWDQIRTDGPGSGGSDTEKRCYYQILDSDGVLLYTITDEQAVEAVGIALTTNEADWEMHPEDGDDSGEAAYIYCYFQEKTRSAGEDTAEEPDYEELVRFTVYQNRDAITLTILGGPEELELLPGLGLEDLLTFTFSVPAEMAETLRDPAQFAETE